MKEWHIKNRKENYIVNFKIISKSNSETKGGVILEKVRGKVYLPSKVTETPYIYFHLNEEQYRLIDKSNAWRFVIKGELIYDDNDFIRISARSAYIVDRSIEYWTDDMSEAFLVLEPIDLKIEYFRPHNNSLDIPKTYGRFWLTPNNLLSPDQSPSHSYTGEVSIKTVWQIKFTLESGLPLTFTNRYRYRKNEEEETITYSELVAEYELEGQAQRFDAVYSSLSDLDDFLRIASLANRYSCVCLGFDISNTEGYILDFYRRDIAIPTPKKNRYDELIRTANIKEFLEVAYHKFIELGRADLIRQAINYTIHRDGRTVENSFISLYSALETLILYFRKNRNLETVFSQEENGQWTQFQRDLRQWLKEYPLLKTDKVKRKLLYENIPALKRIAFSTALEKCFKSYQVDVRDLWPITGNSEGWSLSMIRNKLVHGEYFSRSQRIAISTALLHLRWTVERLILAILNWNLTKSSVDSGYLSQNNIAHKEWKKDRQILSSHS